MTDILQFFTQGIGLVIAVMMIIGYFFAPALLVYAVFSQSRSLRRIADALEVAERNARPPRSVVPDASPSQNPTDQGRVSQSMFGR